MRCGDTNPSALIEAHVPWIHPHGHVDVRATRVIACVKLAPEPPHAFDAPSDRLVWDSVSTKSCTAMAENHVERAW